MKYSDLKKDDILVYLNDTSPRLEYYSSKEKAINEVGKENLRYIKEDKFKIVNYTGIKTSDINGLDRDIPYYYKVYRQKINPIMLIIKN